MRLRDRLALLALKPLAVLSACSGDNPTPPVLTPTISITSATPTATVVAGGLATYPIAITRGGGYKGTVTLSAEGLPANVTATFSPGVLPSDVTVSAVTLSVGSSAPTTVTPHIVTVRASGAIGAGVEGATTAIMLGVIAPSAKSLATASSPCLQALSCR